MLGVGDVSGIPAFTPCRSSASSIASLRPRPGLSARASRFRTASPGARSASGGQRRYLHLPGVPSDSVGPPSGESERPPARAETARNPGRPCSPMPGRARPVVSRVVVSPRIYGDLEGCPNPVCASSVRLKSGTPGQVPDCFDRVSKACSFARGSAVSRRRRAPAHGPRPSRLRSCAVPPQRPRRAGAGLAVAARFL